MPSLEPRKPWFLNYNFNLKLKEIFFFTVFLGQTRDQPWICGRTKFGGKCAYVQSVMDAFWPKWWYIGIEKFYFLFPTSTFSQNYYFHCFVVVNWTGLAFYLAFWPHTPVLISGKIYIQISPFFPHKLDQAHQENDHHDVRSFGFGFGFGFQLMEQQRCSPCILEAL